MTKRLLVITGFLVVVAFSFYIDRAFREADQQEKSVYPAPQYPSYIVEEPRDQDLTMIARGLARQTETCNGRLGVLSQGEKGLIVIGAGQNMRLLEAIVRAVRERGADVDYIRDYQLLMSELGLSEAEAKEKVGMGARQGPRDAGQQSGGGNSMFREGIREALLFIPIQFFPKELFDRMPEVNPQRMDRHEVRVNFLVPALKSYMDKHPEYRYTFVNFWSGSPLRRVLTAALGDRFQLGWRYPDMKSLMTESAAFPADVFRALEDKLIEVVPWIQQVRVTDPEGTDLGFSVNSEEAEAWAKGAYFQNYIKLYPLQATLDPYGYGDLYGKERLKIVAPTAEGVIAGSINHSGVYSTMKVTVQEGMVQKVEGGGRVGDEFRAILKNERFRKAHYPLVPRQGFLYLFQGSFAVNPKLVRDYESLPDIGRSGLMVWGFGLDSSLSDVLEFAEKNDLPSIHAFHIHQYFPTYQAWLRGTDEIIKLVDKGHLAALDDPEIRALASKYGKAAEILEEDFIPALPGINVPGDYWEDYGKDPISYYKKEWQEIQEGTYPHLVERPLPIY